MLRWQRKSVRKKLMTRKKKKNQFVYVIFAINDPYFMSINQLTSQSIFKKQNQQTCGYENSGI